MSAAPLRLGTRRSPLALHQTELVRAAISAIDPSIAVEVVELVSDGDRDPRHLRDIGERGIFAAHLERALGNGDIDAAVHSSKDLPLDPHPTLALAAWLPRADARDALVGTTVASIKELPQGATIATGSARRVAALRTIRADFIASPVRGNVATRIERSAARGDDACLLAMAGLERLGISTERDDVLPLPVDVLVPEAGQGAIVVQSTAHVCPSTGFDWSRIDDRNTRRTVQLERELARVLGGGCTTPVGVHVEMEAGVVHAFAAPGLDQAGTRIRIDLVGLELATLVSVAEASDIDDAVHSIAQQLAPQLATQLGIEVVA